MSRGLRVLAVSNAGGSAAGSTLQHANTRHLCTMGDLHLAGPCCPMPGTVHVFPCPEQPMPARRNDDEQILRAVAVSIYINDWLRRVNDTRRPFLHGRSRPCRVVTANANTAGEDAQHQMTSERDCFSPVEYWRPWLGGSLARGNSHINGHPQPAAGTGRHCVPLAFI